MRHSGQFFLLLSVLVFTACSEDRWEVDTASVDFDPTFARLDREVFSINPEDALQAHGSLSAKYGEVYSDYIEDIMRIGRTDNPMTASLLMRFTTDKPWIGLQEQVEHAFPQMDAFEQELGEGMKRYAMHFNDRQLPRLVAYNSGFNVGIYPADAWLGVGLEWYAGSEHKWVKQLPPDLFPQYKRDKMQPEYLVPNALRGWLLFRFREMAGEEELLDEMIFAGKVTYIAKALLQHSDESRVLNYSEAQLAWSKKNEYDIWKSLVERDVIFSTDLMEINKLLNDGPFTPGMPQESPGGIGQWIGYRMVDAFMEKNQELGLNDLMKVKDNRRILKHYKPGR